MSCFGDGEHDHDPNGRASFTGTQSIPNATFTRVTGMTADYDTDGLWNPATDEAAMPPGKFFLSAHAAFAANVTGRRGFRIFGHPAGEPATLLQTTTTASWVGPSRTSILNSSASWSMSLEVYQESGGPLNCTIAELIWEAVGE